MKPGDVIPSNSVIIPADVAKQMSAHFRNVEAQKITAGTSALAREWADLLDPQPPSLREQVRDALWATLYSSDTRSGPWPGGDRAADAVLGVMFDEFRKLADSHCVRDREGNYAISTGTVGKWLRGES